MDEQAEQRLTLKRNFGDFLDNDHGFGEYADKVRGLLTKENIEKGKLRLEVDLQDLQNFNAGLHRSLLSNPGDCIGPFEEALEELVRNNNQKQLKEHQRVHIAFSGEFGPNRWVSLIKKSLYSRRASVVRAFKILSLAACSPSAVRMYPFTPYACMSKQRRRYRTHAFWI